MSGPGGPFPVSNGRDQHLGGRRTNAKVPFAEGCDVLYPETDAEAPEIFGQTESAMTRLVAVAALNENEA